MSNHKFELEAQDPGNLKEQLLQACSHFDYAMLLDSNKHQSPYSRFDWIAAIGHQEVLSASSESFQKLRELRKKKTWLFGHLSFELKNEVEKLTTSHQEQFEFPHLSFFLPETLIYAVSGKLYCESSRFTSEVDLLHFLDELSAHEPAQDEEIHLEAHESRQGYLDKISSLKEHLQFGNIYEINYCLELSANTHLAEPARTFKKLNRQTAAPFAAFYKHQDQFLLCASPERYLQKRAAKVISQPIKGTAPRFENPAEDEKAITELRQSEKERSENVMITDLVRNDLSRTAQKGSVKVDELFGIYSFATVHQMISTVSSSLNEKFGLADLLATTFPMGSMTGAPKVKALELIDQHESFARQLYSGSVGYITPEGDCDFNVVIRSLLYNSRTGYLSARVGSAITIHCDAAAEYRECLLKAEALLRCLREPS